MRMTTVRQDGEQAEFAVKAAQRFAEDSNLATYGDVKPGGYLAIRWGIGGDCVVVVKLDDHHEPTNYQQIVKGV